jgi:hypothetical protein
VLIAPAISATKMRITISKPASSIQNDPLMKARAYASPEGTQNKSNDQNKVGDLS